MPTPNMGLTLPTNHGSADIWDTILETLFGLVDAHDHTTGKGVKVPSAGLNINADVSWASGGTNYAITDLKAIDFVAVAASSVTALAGALFCNSSDSNNLYWRNTGGTNVRITNGATLDITLVGGIGGDYTSVSALFSFDDATDSYWAQQQGSPRPWARIRAGDLDIYETAASIVNRVRLKSPAALAASYDLTFPAALPAGGRIVQLDNTGAITASQTLAIAPTAPDYKLNASVNGFQLSGGEAIDPNGTHTRLLGAVGAQVGWTLASSTNKIFWALPVKAGDRITSYNVYVNKGSSGANTITARLYRTKSASGGGAGAETAIGSGNSSSANAPGFIVLNETGLTETVAAGNEYYMVFTPAAAGAGDVLYSCEIAMDRP